MTELHRGGEDAEEFVKKEAQRKKGGEVKKKVEADMSQGPLRNETGKSNVHLKKKGKESAEMLINDEERNNGRQKCTYREGTVWRGDNHPRSLTPREREPPGSCRSPPCTSDAPSH